MMCKSCDAVFDCLWPCCIQSRRHGAATQYQYTTYFVIRKKVHNLDRFASSIISHTIPDNPHHTVAHNLTHDIAHTAQHSAEHNILTYDSRHDIILNTTHSIPHNITHNTAHNIAHSIT